MLSEAHVIYFSCNLLHACLVVGKQYWRNGYLNNLGEVI